MSRCFPYPPPGYTLSRASNEALIESIKIQKEREKAKSEIKKDKKREKKEKKKVKEEKAKQKTSNLEHDAYGLLQKERKDDTEQLERSSITEEHEQPISSQKPSYSSDCTQNSNKRKKQESPSLNASRSQGNILRIRLPSQKHINHDITGGDEHLCSTSGRTDSSCKHDNGMAIRVDPDRCCSTSIATDSIVQGLLLRPEKDSNHPSSQQNGTSSQDNIQIDHVSKRFKKMQKVVQKYTDLIENWIPPSQLSETADIDDEWLFGTKHQTRPEKKVTNEPETMVKVINQMPCSGSSLWPRAQYLPEADIYALPYTIPF